MTPYLTSLGSDSEKTHLKSLPAKSRSFHNNNIIPQNTPAVKAHFSPHFSPPTDQEKTEHQARRAG
jgi:hypothetical protein